MVSTEVLERAICFAVKAHAGMVRKSGMPYILHPMEAAAIVGTMTHDPEVIAAALLHDAVEDAGITPAEIEREFGARVAALVGSETENKRSDRPAGETWRVRKEESLAKLHAAQDIAVRMVWLGDKLSNMRSFYAIYLREGDALWQRFNQKDPAAQAWYYRSIARELEELKDYPVWQEYKRLVDCVFEAVPHEGGL